MNGRWLKRGLIWAPDGSLPWARHSFLTPTPLDRGDGTIRIYGGLRDAKGVSRIGYIDVAADDPLRLLKVCACPVLDIGEPGMFDDNGVILGDVARDGQALKMYYVGFQLVQNVKFLAFSGLAVSHDNGETFTRVSRAPILDRADEAPFIRAIHCVIHEGDRWRIWFSVGSGWETIDGVSYPRYNIWYTESPDGIRFDASCRLVLDVGPREYRIGRPRVRRLDDGRYEMRFTYDTLDKQYRTGTAFSEDGIHWRRNDSLVGITPSAQGWDSEMLCYPAILTVGKKTYMFYNGNQMGRTGVGFASLEVAT
jgi:hypothetical protein